MFKIETIEFIINVIIKSAVLSPPATAKFFIPLSISFKPRIFKTSLINAIIKSAKGSLSVYYFF